MKILKRLLQVLLGLVILLVILGVVGYFALTRWINPNDFKPEITALVQKETGRTLTLDGNLSWTLFPNIGIEVNNAALSNPTGFSQPTFASVDSIDLLVSLNALLRGDIEVNHVRINGLQVFLISDGKRNNWTFPMPKKSEGGGDAVGADADAGESFGLMLKEISLNDASFTYDDLVSKTHLVVNNFNLDVPNFTPAEPMDLKASGDFSTDNISDHFAVDTLLVYNQAKNQLTLSKTAINAHLTYITDQNKSISVVLNATGHTEVDLNKQTLDLSNVNFTVNQTLKGQLNMALQNFKTLNYKGTLKIPTFSLVALLESLGQPFPELPNKDQFNRTNFQTKFSGNLQKIALQNLDLGFGQTSIQGDVNVSRFQPLALNESLKVNQLDVADFVDLKGARLLLSNLSAKGRLSTTGFAPDQFPVGLEANQKIVVKEVMLKGFDLAALLQQVDVIVNNVLNLKKVSDSYEAIQTELKQLKSSTDSINAANGKQTDFGTLNAEVVAHRGVVTTPVLSLHGPLVAVNGKGSADLVQKTLNYHFDAKVLASSRNIIKTLDIPANVSGSFSAVNTTIGWGSIQAQITKFIVGQIGRTITSSVGTVISAPTEAAKGLAGALGGIFGGGSNGSAAASGSGK